MLTRLSLRAVQLLDVQFEDSSTSIPDSGSNSLTVDLDALRGLVSPLPDNAWQRVAGVYGNTLLPIFRNMQTMLSEDVEQIAQVLSDLERRHEDSFNYEPVSVLSQLHPLSLYAPNLQSDVHSNTPTPATRPLRKRRDSAESCEEPIVIQSLHQSAPTIVITPCASQAPESSCRVPFQNRAFGNLMTVPAHPTFNNVYPPMIPERCRTPTLRKWKWQDGHWQTVLPSIEEQTKKGMFSRAYNGRRKASRAPSGT
ncbi:hypothetical protein BDQ12DRAFT_732688 [Crucibulum laeve]|uniref:Uncharacterized protein n=1 Tax=Crucibulum laeve TaxID=68775 RepID=A0A5C3MDI6_9AGAR|nr:hypothetical protein BDQ12DRAFT_732688 [Crucibulum laeve]